jgi:hypothetical protein
VVLDVATVKESPRLASRSENRTASPLFPSGTLEIDNVGRLTEEVALEEGWEVRGTSIQLSRGAFEFLEDDFPSHR